MLGWDLLDPASKSQSSRSGLGQYFGLLISMSKLLFVEIKDLKFNKEAQLVQVFRNNITKKYVNTICVSNTENIRRCNLSHIN